MTLAFIYKSNLSRDCFQPIIVLSESSRLESDP